MHVAQTQHEWTATPQQLAAPLKREGCLLSTSRNTRWSWNAAANEPFLQQIPLTHNGHQMYAWDS